MISLQRCGFRHVRIMLYKWCIAGVIEGLNGLVFQAREPAAIVCLWTFVIPVSRICVSTEAQLNRSRSRESLESMRAKGLRDIADLIMAGSFYGTKPTVKYMFRSERYLLANICPSVSPERKKPGATRHLIATLRKRSEPWIRHAQTVRLKSVPYPLSAFCK